MYLLNSPRSVKKWLHECKLLGIDHVVLKKWDDVSIYGCDYHGDDGEWRTVILSFGIRPGHHVLDDKNQYHIEVGYWACFGPKSYLGSCNAPVKTSAKKLQQKDSKTKSV